MELVGLELPLPWSFLQSSTTLLGAFSAFDCSPRIKELKQDVTHGTFSFYCLRVTTQRGAPGLFMAYAF